MKIAFYGDSLTDGYPGVSYFEVLRHRLYGHTLLNYGRFNDTVISLHRRIITRRLLAPVDCSIVWVGVNDILVRQSPTFSRLRRWWARSDEEFHIHYRALLDLLTPHATTVIAASPALIGEDGKSIDNTDLARLGDIIRDLTTAYRGTRFLDLHSKYIAALQGEGSAAYHPPNPFQSVIDAVTLRTPAAVDRVSAERGLRLTLDNVHLNSRGAALAAAEFEKAIRECQG